MISEKVEMIKPSCFVCHLSGLQQEGLFRVSASVRAVESLKQRLDRGDEVDLEQEAEVCTVASLLKLYLRELPEGLVHSSIHNKLIQLYNGEQHTHSASAQLWWRDTVTQWCVVCIVSLENPRKIKIDISCVFPNAFSINIR